LPRTTWWRVQTEGQWQPEEPSGLSVLPVLPSLELASQVL
jgi:hypothetical protein